MALQCGLPHTAQPLIAILSQYGPVNHRCADRRQLFETTILNHTKGRRESRFGVAVFRGAFSHTWHAFSLMCCTQRREGAENVGMQAQLAALRNPAALVWVHTVERFLPSRVRCVLYWQELVTILRDDSSEIARLFASRQTRNVAIHFIRDPPDADGCLYMGAYSWRGKSAHWDTAPSV